MTVLLLLVIGILAVVMTMAVVMVVLPRMSRTSGAMDLTAAGTRRMLP